MDLRIRNRRTIIAGASVGLRHSSAIALAREGLNSIFQPVVKIDFVTRLRRQPSRRTPRQRLSLPIMERASDGRLS